MILFFLKEKKTVKSFLTDEIQGPRNSMLKKVLKIKSIYYYNNRL